MQEEEKKDKPKAEHLKAYQFQKGQSGNPGGRPIVNDIKRFIKERLAEETSKGSGVTKLEAIVQKLMKKAHDGDRHCIDLCIKYGYGNPTQQVEVTGKDGQSLITHDFSKLSNAELTERIAQLEAAARAAAAAEPNEGGGAEA